MKQITKTLLKGLLVIVLFTGGSVVLSTIGANTVNKADAAVSSSSIYKYLDSEGYTVYSLDRVENTENWVAETSKGGTHYITTIYCDGDDIIGTTDFPM